MDEEIVKEKVEYRRPPKKAVPLVLAQKLLDTGDDVLMHLKRSWMPTPEVLRTSDNLKNVDGRLIYTSERPVILVLGSGWAAHSFMKVQYSLLVQAGLCMTPHTGWSITQVFK